LVGLTGLILLASPFGEGLSRLSYDLLFALRPDVPVEDVVIVQMDEESHRVLGQSTGSPWDRALHARLIDQLTAWGAKAVAFDILFLGERDAAADARLVRAARASGRVVFAAVMNPETPRGELLGWQLLKPFRALAEVAPSGVAEEATEDRAVRRQYWNPQFPAANSLAWETARLAGQQPASPINDRWVNYYGPPGWIPRISYHRVLENDPTLHSAISNKVVFVGAAYAVGFTGGKIGDEFRTPFTRWTGRLSSGVEVVATTYLNLARQDWLVRPGPMGECGIVLVSAVLLGLGLAGCRPLVALVLALLTSGSFTALALFLAWNQHVWFPWFIIVGAQVPCGLAWAWFAHMQQLRVDKRSLEQRLALATAASVVRHSSPGTAEALAGRVSSALHAERLFREPVASSGVPVVPDHQLIKRVGAGAYGEVWLARNLLGSYHAVKILHQNRVPDQSPLDREFEGLKRFTPISRSHPNLVQVLHVGRTGKGELYYVMELADDEATGQRICEVTYSPRNLSTLLKKRGGLPPEEYLPLSISLASALQFLHERDLVHRDVKPANVIFVDSVPKLADIGLVADAIGTGQKPALGTPGYMPPEGPGSPAADLYSLGKLIYETAFGFDCTRFPDLPRTLFEQGDETRAFALNRILLKACENEPARRQQSVAELIAELRTLEASLPQPTSLQQR
jgi:CHASE2 domain-containing sensor protein